MSQRPTRPGNVECDRPDLSSGDAIQSFSINLDPLGPAVYDLAIKKTDSVGGTFSAATNNTKSSLPST